MNTLFKLSPGRSFCEEVKLKYFKTWIITKICKCTLTTKNEGPRKELFNIKKADNGFNIKGNCKDFKTFNLWENRPVIQLVITLNVNAIYGGNDSYILTPARPHIG